VIRTAFRSKIMEEINFKDWQKIRFISGEASILAARQECIFPFRWFWCMSRLKGEGWFFNLGDLHAARLIIHSSPIFDHLMMQFTDIDSTRKVWSLKESPSRFLYMPVQLENAQFYGRAWREWALRYCFLATYVLLLKLLLFYGQLSRSVLNCYESFR